jgi:hypothetical protein
MATDTAAAEKPAATESTAKNESVLTADPAKQTSATPPLAAGTTSALPQPWMNGLTTEQKANADLIKNLSRFEKGIPDLVKFYADAEAAKGKAIVVPSEGAPKEELAAYLKAIGVPEKPEDYKLDKPELPDGSGLDLAWDKKMREAAHKLNLSQGQYEALYKEYFTSLAGAMRIVKTTMQQAHAELRKELGADYEAAMTFKTRAVKKWLPEDVAMLFEKTGIGNHPSVIKMFSAMGKAMSDHVFAEGSRGERAEEGVVGSRTDAQLAEALYGSK